MQIEIAAEKTYAVKGSLILLCKELINNLKYKDAEPLLPHFQVISELKTQDATETEEVINGNQV